MIRFVFTEPRPASSFQLKTDARIKEFFKNATVLRVFDSSWDESVHPRDEHGRFAHSTGISLSKSQTKAFNGKPVPINTPITKQQSGALGESIALTYLQHTGLVDARPLNTERNNFAVDAMGDSQAIEIKTGLVSNGPKAQQWRMTIGEPGKKEKAWLASANPEEVAAWNSTKQQRISERKAAVIQTLSEELGRPIKAKTVAVLLNPDKQLADVYSFDGFHDRIGWNSPAAKAGYKGSYKYQETDSSA